MATYNTGKVIVTTLKEVYQGSGSPTGNTKVNSQSDPNYIAPYSDTTACPPSTSITCPDYLVDTTVSKNYMFELQLPPITNNFQVLINGSDYTSVSGVTVYSNNGYIRINMNYSSFGSKPTVAVRMYNDSASVDQTCTLTY